MSFGPRDPTGAVATAYDNGDRSLPSLGFCPFCATSIIFVEKENKTSNVAIASTVVMRGFAFFLACLDSPPFMLLSLPQPVTVTLLLADGMLLGFSTIVITYTCSSKGRYFEEVRVRDLSVKIGRGQGRGNADEDDGGNNKKRVSR